MTAYAVTAATGHLGRLVVDKLIERGAHPGDIVAIARTPEKAADLAGRGVVVREGDYGSPETLPAALEGVDRLLLISGTDMGQRVAQHTGVIEAAKAAGVERITYTSILHGEGSPINLANEHIGTEAALRDSGVAYTVLRNGSYIENYTDQLGQYLASGVILGATNDARIAGATRADFAEAAAVVLVTDGHDNAVYELGGQPTFDHSDIAAAVTEVTGTLVVYNNLTVDELASTLAGFGLDPAIAGFVAEIDRGVAAGGWDTDSRDLERLLGRPTTSLIDAVRAAATA